MNIEAHEMLIALITAVPPTIVATGALVVALRTKTKVSEVHANTNSMKDALVEATRELAMLKGFAAGVASMNTSKPTQSQDAT